jgi:hypothetical protein
VLGLICVMLRRYQAGPRKHDLPCVTGQEKGSNSISADSTERAQLTDQFSNSVRAQQGMDCDLFVATISGLPANTTLALGS